MSQTDTTLSPAHDKLLQQIAALKPERLAPMIAHEYDDEAVVPPPGSPGEEFLFDARDSFVRWVRREGRFPYESDAENAAGTWAHGESTPSQRAQAFVDLGLFWSSHCDAADTPKIFGMQAVLDEAAEQFVVSLTRDYGPIV